MKRYRAYTAKKHKMPKRIIFFCVVALIIVALTFVVGNSLKKKLEETPRDTSDILTTTSPDENKTSGEGTEKDEVLHDEAYAGVVAGYLDLNSVEGADAAAAAVADLKAKGYNAVCFSVTDSEGRITYASPAVEAASRLPASASLVTYEELRSAAKAAKNTGLRLSAVITASESISDELVAKELADLGFDEIIVRGFEKITQLDNEAVAKVCGYVNRLRSVAEYTAFSLSFDSLFFKAPSNAPYIEKIYAAVEFLSIDMTQCTAEDAATLSDEIGGSFAAYLLRPLLSGDNEENKVGVSNALSAASISARQYVSAPAPQSNNNQDD